MFKTRSLCILLLFISAGLGHAEVYRCEEDGSLTFTDNLANFSPSCQAGKVSEVPSLNVTASPPANPVRERANSLRPTTPAEPKQQNDTEMSYKVFKEETETLVEKFVSKRKRVFRNTLTQDKRKARRELSEIRSQKSLLISEIDKSKLNRSQKTELKTTLSAITD
jgi:hypothetical protein